MTNTDKPIANASIVLREEFDDWAILFDPDTGKAFGINPVSVFIWKHLDGTNTIDDILRELRINCDNVPEAAKNHIEEFIQDLVDRGYAEYNLAPA